MALLLNSPIYLFLLLLFALPVENLLLDGFHETRIAQHLDGVYITAHLFKNDTIFIVEKKGRVLICEDGKVLPTPLLDIAERTDDNNERGLQTIGIDYYSNGPVEDNFTFYIYYAVVGQNRNRLSRFRAEKYYANPENEEILVEFDPLGGTIHNGGQILITDDGFLYLMTGDGADMENSWKLTSLMGKALRYNLDGSIPETNPFYYTLQGKYRAIYSTGLRNPFSGSVQRSTGKIFVNDVGGFKIEEINVLESGADFGWPYAEGPAEDMINMKSNYKNPFSFYQHGVFNSSYYCAIVGSAFYEPYVQNFPIQYKGKYFFGDFCAGNIKTMDVESKEISLFATSLNRPISYTVSNLTGAFYYLTMAPGRDQSFSCCGEVYRVTFTGDRSPSFSFQSQNQTIVEGTDATFSVGTSGYLPIYYHWNCQGMISGNGVTLVGSKSSELIIKNVSIKNDNLSCYVEAWNDFGRRTSDPVFLRVLKNNHIKVQIFSPIDKSMYQDCFQTIFLNGTAFDDFGEFDEKSLTWQVIFHHNIHTHPLSKIEGKRNATVKLTFGETDTDIYYSITLEALSPLGIKVKSTVFIYPELTSITLLTDPPGFYIEVDHHKVVTPYTLVSPSGTSRRISAFDRNYNGVFYEFLGWQKEEAEEEAADRNNSTIIIAHELKIKMKNNFYENNIITASFLPTSTIPPGLNFFYYIGNWSNFSTVLSNLENPFLNGSTLALTLNPKRLNYSNFAIDLQGFILVDKGGLYNITIPSFARETCVLRLYLENKVVLRESNKFAVIYLYKGTHTLRLLTWCQYVYSFKTSFISFIKLNDGGVEEEQSTGLITFYKDDPSFCLRKFILQYVPIPDVAVYPETTYIDFEVFSTLLQPTFFVFSGPADIFYLDWKQLVLKLNGKQGVINVTITQPADSLYCEGVPLHYSIPVLLPTPPPLPIQNSNKSNNSNNNSKSSNHSENVHSGNASSIVTLKPPTLAHSLNFTTHNLDKALIKRENQKLDWIFIVLSSLFSIFSIFGACILKKNKQIQKDMHSV